MRIATAITGSLTAAYGALELAKPDILANQTKMIGAHPIIAGRLRRVSMLMGARDVVSGTALALARTPTQITVTAAVRCAFDVIDGIALSAALPPPAPRLKIIGVTFGWAALCGVSAVIARRS